MGLIGSFGNEIKYLWRESRASVSPPELEPSVDTVRKYLESSNLRNVEARISIQNEQPYESVKSPSELILKGNEEVITLVEHLEEARTDRPGWEISFCEETDSFTFSTEYQGEGSAPYVRSSSIHLSYPIEITITGSHHSPRKSTDRIPPGDRKF